MTGSDGQEKCGATEGSGAVFRHARDARLEQKRRASAPRDARPNKDRIDRWLFHARLCRTRVIAQETTAKGRIRLNGVRIEKPGHGAKPGDVLTLSLGGQLQAVRVLALATRRGPAAQARALYEIVAD